MTTISICVGSACHLRGAHLVLQAFQLLMDKHNIQGTVDLAGNFCQGRCTEGVVVKINEEIITLVSKEQVHAIFCAKILRGDQQ